MKHLTDFKPNKKYWLVPKFNNEIFKVALLKINCDKDYIKLLMLILKNDTNDYIFIGHNNTLGTKGWDYTRSTQGLKKLYSDVFEIDGYKFSGVINVEDYEIPAYKYNI